MTVPFPPFPTTARVREIAAMPDPATRNRWITWSYHELNAAMAVVIGDRDLSWCGFATWASNTAGTFIRQEEVPSFLDAWIEGTRAKTSNLASRVVRWLEAPLEAGAEDFGLRRFAQRALRQVTDAIGGGNQNVFANIAPPFARLLETCKEHGAAPGGEERAAFLAGLRASNDAEQGAYLADAFAATFRAHDAADERTRAQQMLHANAAIGYVEQLRVQPYIERSMNAPIADLFADAAHARLLEVLPRLVGRPLSWLLGPLLRRFGRVLEGEFRHLSTAWMMTLDLPDRKLRLGENVPPLPDGASCPEDLASLDAPEPLGILERIQATDPGCTAASDWDSFTQRMRYIGALFRSRQQERTLWEAPFDGSLLET